MWWCFGVIVKLLLKCSTRYSVLETEVVGVALDLDNGKIYFHKSGTYYKSGTCKWNQITVVNMIYEQQDDQWLLGVSAYNLAYMLM